MSGIKRVLSSKIFLFLLLLGVIWLGLVTVRVFYKRYQLEQQISSLKKEISKLDQKSNELSQLLKYFDDQSYLEKQAKEKLNLKEEGESVVMIPEAVISEQRFAVPSASPAPANTVSEQEENNFVKWWKFLFLR